MQTEDNSTLSMDYLNARIKLKEEVFFEELDDQAVILNIQTSTYFGLNEVGTRIWNLLSEHKQVRIVYNKLIEEYDVAAEQIAKDLQIFINHLQSKELIDVYEE
ncbi:MAG: PqqD family protein [Candidatus Poribacteria bacterium]|nr:PqqD family protein [Candidatus Poribacteria bacterium]